MKFLTLIAPALLVSQLATAQAKVVAGKYQVDTSHSKVGFEIDHLVISSVEGKFTEFDGTILIDSKLEKSKVDINIKPGSIDTANADRDKHLRSPDFFDTAKYDKMTFKSTKVTGTPAALKITGDLTLHGVTKPVTLDAKYTGAAKDAYGNERIAFKASTKLNRKDFGLTWSSVVEVGPVVGDEIAIDIKIEAVKEKATAAK